MVHMYYDEGVTTSDKDILKREIIRRIIYKQSNNNLTFKNAVILENLETLDLKLSMPKAVMLRPEKIKEGSRAGLKTLEWFDVNETMETYQLELEITDDAKARELDGMQTKYSMQAVAEGFTYEKDLDICTTLTAARAAADAASGKWNDSTTEIGIDIATTIGEMLEHAPIKEKDIPNICLFYPVKLWGFLSSPIQIGQVQQSIRSWVKQEFNINWYPTNLKTTSVLAVLRHPQCATHMTYTGKALTLVEPKRNAGVSDSYIVTQKFKTFIVPEEDGGTTNNMIREITGVL